MTRLQAAFMRRLIASGRPSCPYCEEPMGVHIKSEKGLWYFCACSESQHIQEMFLDLGSESVISLKGDQEVDSG